MLPSDVKVLQCTVDEIQSIAESTHWALAIWGIETWATKKLTLKASKRELRLKLLSALKKNDQDECIKGLEEKNTIVKPVGFEVVSGSIDSTFANVFQIDETPYYGIIISDGDQSIIDEGLHNNPKMCLGKVRWTSKMRKAKQNLRF